MNPTHITGICTALREAIGGGESCCVTFTANGDGARWIQFVGSSLNCAYPRETQATVELLPSELRAGVGGVELVNWEAGSFVTFEVGVLDVEALARLIDAIFVELLACTPGDYRVDIEHEQL